MKRLLTAALALALGAAGIRAAGAKRLEDPAAEPALPTGLDIQDRPYPKLRYARFPGRAFPGPLRWDRVVQGELGSCFFLSTLAEIAKTRPDLLAKNIRDDGHGAYVVTLFGADGKPNAVAVDDRFPATEAGAPYFGRGLDAGEIRPALFEKAFAKLSGGYSAIDGGDATAAFRALTGAPGLDHETKDLSGDGTWSLLASAQEEGRPVVASTKEAAALKSLSGREDMDGAIDDHVYAVVGVSERAGTRLVRLYTPLSPGDAGYAKDGPRFLDLPVAAFRRYFDVVTVGSAGD